MSTLEERLTRVMTELGIKKKKDFADFCGVTRSLVSQWFAGSTKLGAVPLQKLSKTNFNIEWITEGALPIYRDAPAPSNVTSIYKRAPQTRFEWLDLATTKATLALKEDAIKGDKLSLLIWYFYEELVDNKGEDITPEKEERIIKLVANSR